MLGDLFYGKKIFLGRPKAKSSFPASPELFQGRSRIQRERKGKREVMADHLPRSIMYASRMRYLKSREGDDRKNNRRGSLEMFAADEDTSGALGCLEIKEPCR